MQHLNESDYPLLRNLLLIDSEYEMEKYKDTYSYQNYLDRYQKLLDQNHQNIVLKKLVAIRVRYALYKK